MFLTCQYSPINLKGIKQYLKEPYSKNNISTLNPKRHEAGSWLYRLTVFLLMATCGSSYACTIFYLTSQLMMGVQVPARFFFYCKWPYNEHPYTYNSLSFSFFPTYLSIAGGEIPRNVIARSKCMFFFNFISYC